MDLHMGDERDLVLQNRLGFTMRNGEWGGGARGH